MDHRRAWSAPSTVQSFRDREGWTDPGERAAFECVRADAADQPILDLGVGAGRTVSLLRSISRDYVGLDYTPELVGVCRQKHPGVRIVQGDARDLSQFADGSSSSSSSVSTASTPSRGPIGLRTA